ncbi:hypothetical protein [Rubricoccus marinus]|uniref:Uncharacterized protein n=1 Tax=Rubricoccus marinus TaxID=716817 RepID=A0A259TY04_9BACT|nr:hypothetical protein [Rubricoccus marinus]OZC02629.1 hypothetical protein BSZ36_06350 [Rubricoccus marinus]
MRPDAIPVTPLASRAVLAPEDAKALFGSASLRGSERVDIIRLGEPLATVSVSVGAQTRVETDKAIAITDHKGLRLSGPLGAVAAPEVAPVRSRLVAPSALRRAWGLGETGTLVLGPIALSLPIEDGTTLGLFVEHTLWVGAGSPATARWVAGLDLGIEAPREAPASGASRPLTVPRRVVTETDVRQAMLRRQRLTIRPDQIVTPAAASLAREHGVFA